MLIIPQSFKGRGDNDSYDGGFGYKTSSGEAQGSKTLKDIRDELEMLATAIESTQVRYEFSGYTRF
jgi:hypothetical protein